MAKYLKPKRGKFREATAQDIVLGKGELFLCMANDDDMGKGPGAIYVGDNMTSFTNYAHNGSTVPNTAQPFLIHPINYKPIFTDSSPSTASWTFDAATAEIDNIGNGTGQVTLPNIIGNIKSALSKHADSLNNLNEDLHYAKYIDTESDLNDFTDHGFYVFSMNNVPANHPNDWTVADPFILQVIRDESTKNRRVPNNLHCQQIIYYGDDTYTRNAKWQNVELPSGWTIFTLVWSEWHCNTLREEISGTGIDGVWSVVNVGSNTKIGFCKQDLTGKTITSSPTEFIIASPKITGYKPSFHQCTAYIVGDNTSRLGYSAMDRNTGAIDSYISGTPGTNKTIVVDNMVVYTKVY